MNDQIKPVTRDEITNPHLSPVQLGAMLKAMNRAIEGLGAVYVSLTYPKQTDAPAAVPGRDFIALVGVSPDAHFGKLTVKRYVDNRQNRKLGRVGKPWGLVDSATRGDGEKRTRPTAFRPNDVTGFAETGYKPYEEGEED